MRKSVIFLLVYFFWVAGQNLDLLVRHQIKSDYFIFQNSGVVPLFFIFVVIIFILNITTIYSLYTRFHLGFYAALSSLMIGAVFSCISMFMVLRDIPGVRDAYRKGREIRGLTIREEALDMIFTEKGMYYTLGVVLLVKAIVLFFVLRNRKHFTIR